MTEYFADESGDLTVVSDEAGHIVAAAMSFIDMSTDGGPGAEAAPQVTLMPAEGQSLHRFSAPQGSSRDELFLSLDDWQVVQTENSATLAPRT